MSTKKSTTKKPSREELRKQLAENVAAILANPECPTNLYNAVADAITDWTNATLTLRANSAEFIEQNLVDYIAAEEKRKGGRND